MSQIMKETIPTKTDANGIVTPKLSFIEEQLYQIYWCKKELEGYLPNIATYATPKELMAITLSQLAAMESHLINLLKNISEEEDHLQKE
jgi:hypothetical protein